MNGSGENEILLGGTSALFSFEPNGVLTTNFPKILRSPAAAEMPEWNAPAVLQLETGSEPLLFVGNSSGQLQAFSRSNHRLFAYPLQTKGTLVTAPVLCRLETNGVPVVSVISTDGFLYVWRVPQATAEKSRILWPGEKTFQTALQLSVPAREAPAASDLTGKNWAYNYPNPTHGDATTIRYHLNASAKVTVKIMDLVGNLVQTFSGPGDGPADHEIVWNVASVPSGVYLARVEASGSGQKKVRFFKIAVVK